MNKFARNTSKAAADDMVALIRELITSELSERDSTCVCKVNTVNEDGTYDVFVEPDEATVIHNLSYISGFVLKKDDYVYVYKIRNQLSNAFILKPVFSAPKESVEKETTTIVYQSGGGSIRNYVTTNTDQVVVGTKVFTGAVGNIQSMAGVYLGLDANPGAPNANISIVSNNSAAYIDMGTPDVDYGFRIIKWNSDNGGLAQFTYGGGGTITVPNATGTIALTSDLTNVAYNNVDNSFSTKQTISGGLSVGGRYVGSGDDEGIIITTANNHYAGLCLGDPSGIRSVFYFNDQTHNAWWRYHDGTNICDLLHPQKAGTIATTDDVDAVQEEVDNLKGIGRFLAIWNCSTGLPTSYPPIPAGAEYPYTYTYKTGDYYRVGASGTTIPDGSSIIKQSSSSSWTIGTRATTSTYNIGDVIYYDGSVWKRQVSSGGGVVQDVTVNGTSILSSGIANLNTNSAYNATSNKLATMLDVPSSTNFVTTNTVQNILKPKIIIGLDSDDGTSQPALLKVLNTGTATLGDTNWKGRIICGAENKTFLLGTYNGLCGLGAHSWTSASSGTGAAWESIYINPDGTASVFLGGSGWTANSGVVKIDNSAFNAYLNKGTAASPTWQALATTSDLNSYLPINGGSINGQTLDLTLLNHSNEFNFVPSNFSGDLYINYRPADSRTNSAAISCYSFNTGVGSTTSYANIKAGIIYQNGSQVANLSDLGTQVSYSYSSGTLNITTL